MQGCFIFCIDKILDRIIHYAYDKYMRLKEKYIKWRNSKNIFKLMDRKTLLLISIIVITILIIGTIICFFMAIYTKDKPDFIPKETRGSIREGIKNDIAKPLAAVIPAVGNPFYNAAFTYKNNDSFTNSNNFDNTNSSNFKDWKTYKNEELGFELKYPEDFIVNNNSNHINIISSVYKDSESEFPGISISVYNNLEKETDISKWVDENKYLFIGDQETFNVEGFLDRKDFKIASKKGVYFDWLSMGETRNYVYIFNNKIFDLNILGSNNGDLINIAEQIIFNMTD